MVAGGCQLGGGFGEVCVPEGIAGRAEARWIDGGAARESIEHHTGVGGAFCCDLPDGRIAAVRSRGLQKVCRSCLLTTAARGVLRLRSIICEVTAQRPVR